MKGLVGSVEVHTPKNLEAALDFLHRENGEGRWKILAGATDLGVEFNAGKLKHDKLLNIWPLRRELSGIKIKKTGVFIGALATFTAIQQDKTVQKWFPNLVSASRLVGGVQIQNRGTIGGNIANASPAGDSLPTLLSYDAILHIGSSGGDRVIPMTDFFKGYKVLDLRPTEMIKGVELTVPPAKTKSYFRKVGTRQAQAISKVVAAGTMTLRARHVDSFRFSLGSVGPFPLRCAHVEKFLVGKSPSEVLNDTDHLAEILRKDISPLDDIRSTRDYRNFVSRRLLEEFLKANL